MLYPEAESICYVCLTSDDQELIRCGKCRIPIHKECAELFELERGGTYKKVHIERSIYSQVRSFPQLNNSSLQNWFQAWVCEKCLEAPTDQIPCHFCKLRDGLMVKIKFPNENKKPTKGKENSAISDFYKWAHLNCIIKLYGYKPPRDPSNKCYMLEKDELAEAPECKRCEAPYKMDVKCRVCHKFYAHNLCLLDDKASLRVCSGCDKVDEIQGKLDSNSSGIYISRFFRDLVDSRKYDDFCKNIEEKSKSQKLGKKKTEEVKETMAVEGEEKEQKITDHFMKLNNSNQIVYNFPFATKDLFFESFKEPKEAQNPNPETENLNIALQEEPQQISEEIGDPSLFKLNEIPEELDFMNDESLRKMEIEFGIEENKGEENIESNERTEPVIENRLELQPTPSQIVEEKPVNKFKGKKVFKVFKEEVGNKQTMKKKRKTLDELVDTVGDWYYISSIQILKQLQKIYLSNLEDKVEVDKIRLTKKWYELLEDLQDKGNNTCLKSYDEKMIKEISAKFSLYAKYRVGCETWPMIPLSFRRYEGIEDYVPCLDTDSFKKELQKTISSKKTHKCSTNCACCDLSTLGPYLLEKQVWDTECPGRAGLMECNEHCGCDLTKCKNKSILSHKRKRLGVDLKETFCWGIDYATHNNILLVLPDLKEVDRNDFIEKKLLRAVHLTETPWDMTAVCKQIILESHKPTNVTYTKTDRKLAKMLIRAIKFVSPFDGSAFRLHTKGYGVICINPDGISVNDMIAEYFGEIYTPWRWFEKQDLIKKYSKDKKMKDELPDFYNIMLEKHKDDPDGYDILIVDPINKGTYSSRFSHSCDPNSATVTTITNGKYGVAMYSLKDISFGEELTFDYFSVTENEKEYEQAICLCGSQHCRIHYLNLVTSKYQNSYLEKTLPFLELNYILFIACLDPLTEEDQQLLDQFSMRGSVVDGCPPWLVKWIALILRFIQEEKEEYVNFVLPKRKQELEAQNGKRSLDFDALQNLKKYLILEKLGLESDRIQNLTITINKVKYVLGLIKEKREGNVVEEEYSKPKSRKKKSEKSEKAASVSGIVCKTNDETLSIASSIPSSKINIPSSRDETVPRARIGPIESSTEENNFSIPLSFFDLDFPGRLNEMDKHHRPKGKESKEAKEAKEVNKATIIKAETQQQQQLSASKMELEEEMPKPEMDEYQSSDSESSGPKNIKELLIKEEEKAKLLASKKEKKAAQQQASKNKKSGPFTICRLDKNQNPVKLEEFEEEEKKPEQGGSATKVRSSARKTKKKTGEEKEELLIPLVKVPLKKVCKFLWDTEIKKEMESITEQNMYSYFKIENNRSEGIINEVLQLIQRFNIDKEKDAYVEKIQQLSLESFKRFEGDDEAQFYIFRRLCFLLSNIVRSMPKSNGHADWHGMSDILYFYSMTFTYFMMNDYYTSVSSEKEVTVRKCDIPDFTRYFEKNDFTAQDEAVVLESNIKTYGSSYIWAQLSIWWKQTIDKPETILTTERRGTLCYPSITSSFVDLYPNNQKEFEYPHKTRENWLKKIIESPWEPWPIVKNPGKKQIKSWQFKNEMRMYGSFLFDCLIDKERYPDLPTRLIEEIDRDDNERKKMFDEVNNYYFERINYTLPEGV